VSRFDIDIVKGPLYAFDLDIQLM